VLLVVGVLVVAGVTARAAAAEPINFDIKPQSMGPALRAFAEQANVQVYYPEDLVAGLKTAGVKGRLEIEPALTELLKGSGLGFQRTDLKTIVIVKVRGATAEGPASRFHESVVVSATRREEKVQDIPGSVSVVRGEELQESGAAKLEDYIQQTPGVNLNKTEVQRSQVVMRGLSTAASTGGNQTPVSIFVDDVAVTDYFIPISTLDLTPFDLDRVEVLRGPQGTLFGAASMGGALRYITKKPNLARTEGAVSLTPKSITSGGVNYQTQAMFNVVLAPDTFALRGVVSYTKDNGYVDNLAIGKKDWNSYSQEGGRLLAEWKPSERLRLDASVILQDTDNNGTSALDPTTSGADFEHPSQKNYREATDKYRLHVYNVGVHWDIGAADFLSSTSYVDKQRPEARYEYGALAAFNSVTGIENLVKSMGPSVAPGDLSSKVKQSVVNSPQFTKVWTQEFRLVSKAAGPFNWIAGAYYADANSGGTTISTLPGIESAVNAVKAGLGSTLFSGDQTISFLMSQEAKEWAAYGELGLALSDQWKMTAGGRYFEHQSDSAMPMVAYGRPIPVGPFAEKESGFMPRVSLARQTSSGTLWYALISRGYRVGGANLTAALSPPSALIPMTIKPDNLWNYETGVKGTWLDGRVAGEATVFYLDWSDIQLTGSFAAPESPSGVILATLNTGKAHSLGFEGLLGATLTPGLNLNTSVAWTDAKLDEDSVPILNSETGKIVVLPKGTRLPSTPEWSVAAALSYYLDKPGLGYPSVSLSYAYKGSITDSIPQLVKLPAYSLWNLRLGSTIAKQLQLSLAVNNLLDERSPVGRSAQQKGTYVPLVQPQYFWITEPRSISLTVQKVF
jgi:outer membrane receptor protein involved in Fe transport